MDDIVSGNWKQLRGKFKEWWGDLTDDELDQVAGKKDQMVGLLQKKYGWSKVKAEEEYDRHMREYELQHPTHERM